jgi:poly(3-hydroxybutyrate) depolymerase
VRSAVIAAVVRYGCLRMMYRAYQAQSDFLDPVRALAKMAVDALDNPPFALPSFLPVRNLSAAYSLLSRSNLSHIRPDYGIASVKVGNREVEVHEEVAHVTPFGTLLRFKKDVDTVQPRVLLVAPLSGHFATLLRATVKTILPDHDVYITDWHNARDVPLEDGKFGFDEYIEHLIRFLDVIGPGAHIVAVCQPCVAALVAVAVMAEQNHRAQAASMTLMAGPIDTRQNPTKVNELAQSKPMEWFEKNLIATVPSRYPGGGRRVYPGFVQLAAFMSMNMARHVKAHMELYDNLAKGEHEKAKVTKDFYDEYFAVLDLAADFYLETVRIVFQDHELPLGTLTFRGNRVEPRAIRKTALLTVEGERDDICAIGQTVAAHDLCTSIRPYMKKHHMQAGVGHYGVFSGTRWTNQIYPILKNVVLSSD